MQACLALCRQMAQKSMRASPEPEHPQTEGGRQTRDAGCAALQADTSRTHLQHEGLQLGIHQVKRNLVGKQRLVVGAAAHKEPQRGGACMLAAVASDRRNSRTGGRPLASRPPGAKVEARSRTRVGGKRTSAGGTGWPPPPPRRPGT